MSKTLNLEALHELATRVLINAGTSSGNAAVTATALAAADADGLASHGVSRLPFYADQVLSGKVDGRAEPVLAFGAKAVVRVDARDGFAYPAIKLGLAEALARLPEMGTVSVVVNNSHHFGAAGYHVEQVAAQGFVALGFSNSPAAIAPWGGSSGSFGTNPIAFACPRLTGAPLVVDLSLSKVARGKVMLADKQSDSIPADWALDNQGRPTTDPRAALAGTMLPIGDAKGAALALLVEILTAGLSGAHFAFQASSFFSAEGAPPRIGQLFVLFDPVALFGNDGFTTHVEALLADVLAQPGTRLPGERRLAARAKAKAEGVAIPQALYAELVRRAGTEYNSS